jgi:hypothetical protein
VRKLPSVWYHGDSSQRDDFDDQHWDRERHQDPNAEGPGIYFTGNRAEAESYGDHIYGGWLKNSFRLMPVKLMTRHMGPTAPLLRFLRSMYKHASPLDRETFLLTWGYEGPGGAKQALSSYYDLSLHEAAIALYRDLYRGDADAWVKAVVASGYDGSATAGGIVKHLIVWNPSRMSIRRL